MKYSQTIGILAGMALIATCFFPWTYIGSRDITVTGMSAPETNFGRPGLMNIYVTAASILLFAVPRIWAKRANIFFTMFNLAWSIRNFIIVTACLMGECPVKQPAIYILVALSVVMLAMSVMPKLQVKPRQDSQVP